MKIDNFVQVVNGRLITTPAIDAFSSISFDSSRVTQGELFIDFTASKENILEALEKGAYAILTTLDFMGEDKECAWVKVDAIEQALQRLLRYAIVKKSLEIILLNPIQASLLEQIQTPKTIKYLKDDIFFIAKAILNAKENEQFCLCDKALVYAIAPNANSLNLSKQDGKFISSKGLFLSSFCYKDHFYIDQKIPSHFVNELLFLLNYCDTYKISYSLENLNFCEHFFPQFITPKMRKKEFGSSDKVLIFEPSLSLLQPNLKHISNYAKSAKVLLCIPRKELKELTFEIETLLFDSIEELRVLEERKFQYALILADKEQFEPLFVKNITTQPTLF